MRNFTASEIRKLEVFTAKSIELTLIEPTANGLSKSIMDATFPVRQYLKDNGLHDYNIQKQGTDNKVVISTTLMKPSSVIHSMASLYRPTTKKGDPRIWFTKLREVVHPNDLVGIIAFERQLYVINITQLDIDELINGYANNPLKELVREINSLDNQIADELLKLLRVIATRGPIPALLNADTAVGRTLETLLGVNINSSKLPDFKGIELKSYRDERNNRKTLFAQVPNWELSKFKSSAKILDNFGYASNEDFKLYCTVSSLSRNSQGLMFRLDSQVGHLLENSNIKDIGDFVVWSLETLHKRLLEKHNETFWIGAESLMIEGIEHFKYKKVEHTKKPLISQFDILLEKGIITMDHLIKRNSKGRVSEKGPLFKIRANALNLLFPPSQIHNLI